MFTSHEKIRVSLSNFISHKIFKLYELELDPKVIYSSFGPTPSKEAGDLAFPLFEIAKKLKSPPPKIAQELAKDLEGLPDIIKSIKVIGPYLNFFVDHEKVASNLIPQIISGDFFKLTLTEAPPKTMIEYSQPNTHKELHVGHMRNLCYGNALVNIHRYCSIPTLSSTFPGDVGTHVAKCLWFYKNHNTEEVPSSQKGAWLGRLYSKAHNKLEDERGSEKEESNRLELTKILHQLEKKEGEYFDLWVKTREWSIEQMNDVYSWANVKFDHWYWESEVDSPSVELIREYHKKGLFKEDKGCIGIDLSDDNLGFCMLIKTDGNGLYATKDIELARRKFKDHKIEKSLYVVDKRQEHHFKQVFKVLELMGFEEAKKCHHLPYDFVELPDGAMSSRKGNIVPLQALITQMTEMIKTEYLKKYIDQWPQETIEATAKMIAEGAIKYGMNKIDPHKKIVFDMKDWLKLDGESGPYIQYTHARIFSLVRKNPRSELIPTTMSFSATQERDLILKLIEFNLTVEESCRFYKPSLLTSYLYDLSRLFNSFYAECPVASAETEVKNSRLALCESVALTLKTGLSLLGVQAPEQM